MKQQLEIVCSRIAVALFSLSVWSQAVQASPTDPNSNLIRDRICLAECRQDSRTCLSATRQQARMCGEGCVAALRDAVRACIGNPLSKGCQASRDEVRECLSPCAQDRATASRNCRADTRTCFAQCPEVEPLPLPGAKDPNCVVDCASVVAECVPAVREQARVCLQDGCAELLDDLSAICAQDGVSEACQLARRAVMDCQRDCRNTLRDGTRNCARNGEDCLRSCPDPEPAPPSPPAD
jgi:hypothetical protein